MVFPGGSDSKESVCNTRHLGLISGLGRSHAEEYRYLLQYSCLEDSMDRGAWQTTVHGVAKNQTQLREIYSSLCSSYRFAHDCTMDRGAGRLESTGLHIVRHDGCSLARMHLPDQPHLYRRND